MNTSKLENKTVLAAAIVALALVVAMMAAFVVGMHSYVKQAVHRERSVYLTNQTESITDILNKSLNQYSDYAEVAARVVEEYMQPNEDIFAFVDKIHDMLYIPGARLILVDSECTWYGEDNTSGRITSVSDYESSTADEVVYMTTGVDVTTESIVYRVRLPKPIQAQTPEGKISIEYCAVICYMDTLQTQLDNAFPYACNSFIVDDTGLMIYKNFALGILIKGTNLFSKYERVDFLYGDSAADQLADIKQGKTTVGEFALGRDNYFICTAELDVNNWYASFVVNDDELAVGDYIHTMFLYISGIGILFMLVILAVFLLLTQIGKSRRQLEIERSANVYLEQASVAKSEFLSNMSHDIRTPINGIMGMTLLAMREDNPPKTADCLQRIDGASHYLLSLVNDVLDMSSIESGKIVITNKPQDLYQVAQDCAAIIQGQIGSRKLDFYPELDKLSNLHVMADALHLRQVLINLLSNAVKYTRDGGKIWFRMKILNAEEGKLYLRFQVEDTGIGMKPEFLDKIWDSFSQEEGGSRSEYKGTGLGMTIAKNLTERMGGTISVVSEYEVGSTFTVDIPFEIAATPEQKEQVPQGSGDIRGARILLVEDNELNLMIAQELLEDEGAVITTAVNGREALDTFAQSEPDSFDLILMDVMMPELNGLEATRAIRSLMRRDARTVPIIAMTAKAFDSDIQETRAAGMNAHLTKPIDLTAMLNTLSAYYHRSEGEEE